MAKIFSRERVVEYTTEFNVNVVELTNYLDVDAVTITGVLELHPVMVYRWRQEHREGLLVDDYSILTHCEVIYEVGWDHTISSDLN